MLKKQQIKTKTKLINIATKKTNKAAKYFPKTIEKSPTKPVNKSLSVFNLNSSLKSPIVRTGVEKIIIKKSEPKNPLKSKISVLTMFKKNKSPAIEKNKVKKIIIHIDKSMAEFVDVTKWHALSAKSTL